jgi:pSer/pThr/pTyr-binding forkhead associated (FHA) protein
LHHAAVTVGRGSDNDLVLDHPQVSRHHARLEPAEPGWVVIDLGSTNGTWRNGTAVADAPLELHDEIAFGGVRYVVVSR